MKRVLKVVGLVLAVVVVGGLAVFAYLYMTLCTSHAHGLC